MFYQENMTLGAFKTGKFGIFASCLIITSKSGSSGRVWHIDGMRFETLNEVRKSWPRISEEYLLELVLIYGIPKKDS